MARTINRFGYSPETLVGFIGPAKPGHCIHDIRLEHPCEKCEPTQMTTAPPVRSPAPEESLTYPDRLRVLAAHNPALSDELMWIADEMDDALTSAHRERDEMRAALEQIRLRNIKNAVEDDEMQERCAKVADDHAQWAREADPNYGGEAFARGAERAASMIAEAIRALSPPTAMDTRPQSTSLVDATETMSDIGRKK